MQQMHLQPSQPQIVFIPTQTNCNPAQIGYKQMAVNSVQTNPLNTVNLRSVPTTPTNIPKRPIPIPIQSPAQCHSINDIINYVMQQPSPMQPKHINPSLNIQSIPLPKLENDLSLASNSTTDTDIGTKKLQSVYCTQCGKHFKNTFNLSLHTRKEHTNLACPVCGNQFVHRANLKQHMRTHRNNNNAFALRSPKSGLVHFREQFHKCNVCFKAFRKQSDMVTHKMVHRGEKQFVCTICNCSFKAKATQIKHMKHAHPLVWETIKHRFSK